MNWDKIETKWAEMARRIQAAWPDNAIFPRDSSTSDSPRERPADVITLKPVRTESSKAEVTSFPAQIQGRIGTLLDDLPEQAFGDGRNRA